MAPTGTLSAVIFYEIKAGFFFLFIYASVPAGRRMYDPTMRKEVEMLRRSFFHVFAWVFRLRCCNLIDASYLTASNPSFHVGVSQVVAPDSWYI